MISVSPDGGCSGRAADRAEAAHLPARASARLRRHDPRPRIASELFIAARADGLGVVEIAAGPFLDVPTAQAYLDDQYGGDGYVVPFDLVVFQRP